MYYVLGNPLVVPCTMRCVHGSNNEILSEWDPGSIYVGHRLWDPGGPSNTSRSSFPVDIEKLGKPNKLPRLYPLTQTIIPTIPSCPSDKSSS